MILPTYTHKNSSHVYRLRSKCALPMSPRVLYASSDRCAESNAHAVFEKTKSTHPRDEPTITLVGGKPFTRASLNTVKGLPAHSSQRQAKPAQKQTRTPTVKSNLQTFQSRPSVRACMGGLAGCSRPAMCIMERIVGVRSIHTTYQKI